MDNSNRRVMIISLGVIILLLLIGAAVLTFMLIGRNNSNLENPDLVANLPSPTFTITPLPTETPTLTATPLPTETPTPLPSPTPAPLELAITGPKFVPNGLPVQVEWTISAVGGTGVAIVSLEDLGGSMAVGDDGGNVIIARTISPRNGGDGLIEYDEVFTIRALIDPNVKEGTASFLIDNNIVSETLFMSWKATDQTEIENINFTVLLDGIEDDSIIEALGESESEETVVDAINPGFAVYESRNDLIFEYPNDWFLSETLDDNIQLSAEPIGPATSPTEVEGSYALIVSGTQEEIGLPGNVEFTNAGITSWLLGNRSGSDVEDVPTLAESGLQIVAEFDLQLNDGSVASAVELASEGSDEQPPFKALYIVKAEEEKAIIMTAYSLLDQDDSIIFNQIAETMTLGGG